MIYTIEQVHSYEAATSDRDLIYFLHAMGCDLSAKHENRFDWQNFPLELYIKAGRLIVCRRYGKVVGVMFSRLFDSLLDPKVKLLKQDLLYAVPGTRATKLLMDEFIDFGKREADHIITMTNEFTNIKRKTLMKLGFRLMETQFRLDV